MIWSLGVVSGIKKKLRQTGWIRCSAKSGDQAAKGHLPVVGRLYLFEKIATY